MKAVGYQKSLPIENDDALQDIELAMPEVTGRDLLVEVKAVSVNPADYFSRKMVSAPEGEWRVLGWDAAGVVKAVGDNVTLFKPGDSVYYAGDMTRSGSNAEFQLVDERIVGHMPQSLSYSEAAALPLTALTAWEMLFQRMQIPLNDANTRVLLVGAAGGVGSIMVQLLKARTRATIVATASRQESVRWLQGLGADYIINHRNSLVEEMKSAGVSAAEYVIGLNNSADHFAEMAEIVVPQGHMGTIDMIPSFDVMALGVKSVAFHTESMFTRSMFQTPDMVEQHHILNKVAALIDAGKIKSTMAHDLGTINAQNLRKAHAMLEAKEAHGKIVLAGF